ncbi:hypothetical protein D9M69_712900 [compost metagenome]
MRSAKSFSMKMKISDEPSRSRMNQSSPMYGVWSAKSCTGTLCPPSSADTATSRNAADESQRERLKMMLTSESPPAMTSAVSRMTRITSTL